MKNVIQQGNVTVESSSDVMDTIMSSCLEIKYDEVISSNSRQSHAYHITIQMHV
jgi:hypothetical protein